MKGPAIFLAQFVNDDPPFNTLEGICQWAADMGYKGIQIPTWVPYLIDLKTASESKDYCDELNGKVKTFGLNITEISTHLQGQLVAVNPAYDDLFAGFGPAELKADPVGRQVWATDQVIMGAKASRHLGIDAHVTFSGGLMWHTVYPWPQRPAGLVEGAFKELAKRWMPILNAHEEVGVDVCYEIHPGEDIHDGVTFEMFREATGNHSRACINYDPSHFLLQQLDYLHFIDLYHPFIKAFHVKDAEFNPNGRVGVYGGYQNWKDRAGRFRSLGDGQIDFKGIFSKLTQYGYNSWAVLEWECCIKDSEQGAREGSAFIRDHLIEGVKRAFDDFAAGDIDQDLINKIIGNA